MLLYGSPIWAEDRKITQKNTKALRKLQRLMAIRVIKAYRTISAEAAITLAGMTPLDHLAGAYTEIYWGCRQREQGSKEAPVDTESVRQNAIRRAQEAWRRELESTGASRKRAIAAILPNWERWMEEGPDVLTYRVTQILTGHGCFGDYLEKIGAEMTTACHHCEEEIDNAQHTLEKCQAFEVQRNELVAVIGEDLSPAGIIRALLAGGREKKAVLTFCEEVMIIKETTERERERSSTDRRRRRRGRPSKKTTTQLEG